MRSLAGRCARSECSGDMYSAARVDAYSKSRAHVGEQKMATRIHAWSQGMDRTEAEKGCGFSLRCMSERRTQRVLLHLTHRAGDGRRSSRFALIQADTVVRAAVADRVPKQQSNR